MKGTYSPLSPARLVRRIYVTDEVWEQLMLLKVEKRLRSVNDAIRYLLLLARRLPEQREGQAEGQPAPLPYREGGGKAGAGGDPNPAGSNPAAAGRRRARSLEELEDCAVIAGVRRPEALRRRCAELGLRLCELDEVGAEGVAVVCAEPWLQYVSYLAEEEPERLPKGSKALEDRFAEILRKARRGGELSEEEKAVAALWVLWREGEVFWDGARWRKPPKVEARQPEVEPPPPPEPQPSGG